MTQMTCQGLADSGERMLPETADPATFWEHIYRYRFASRFVRHKRVLDIACGEGYGAAAFVRAGAASVLGIDISEETCEHARRKYGIDARPGSAESIPLPARTIDVVVSFETIEHLAKPDAFLTECVRVLAPGGVLIISTPNREIFHAAGRNSPFHCSEFSEAEFHALLSRHLSRCRFYGQWPWSVAWWSPHSLASSDSEWLAVRGFWRLREFLRRKTCPHIWDELIEGNRRSPVELILSRDRWLASLVNPYCVTKRSSWRREQPIYIIARAGV
jgi:SAM-dependent methyltransferase